MHDIAIIGAGPYGLSLAAHLAKLNIDFRIFGAPMQTWRHNMPAGMHLKSEGFASSLYDAARSFSLSLYCQDRGIPYQDIGLPVHLDTFVDYGVAFQERFVGNLELSQVKTVRQHGQVYAVELETGEEALFRRIILATGIMPYAYMAEPLGLLPAEVASHASARRSYSGFAGRRVAVVGGGASAVDCAVALADVGAAVTIVTRRPSLRFHKPPVDRTWRDRLCRPVTTIGLGWKSVLFTRGPLVFRHLPASIRHDVTRRYLGPAPGWFTRARVESSIAVCPNLNLSHATLRGGRVLLDVHGTIGASTIEADHVIAATGYRINVDRLSFLHPVLRAQIKTVEKTPTLSSWFESSASGLFFIGPSSANVFGPLVRFACGADFTARRLTMRLAGTRLRTNAE